MKKVLEKYKKAALLIASVFMISVLPVFAGTDELTDEETVQASHGGLGIIPEPKRPKPIDEEKAAAAAAKDENGETEAKNRKTVKYGLPSEISKILDDLIANEDPRFTEEIYDLFQTSRNAAIKQKILDYFTRLEDPCLEDYAVEILNDPYDEKKDVVNAVFKYVQAVKTSEALPPVLTLVESENEEYFNQALATVGELGGKAEAQFIAEFLERDDLPVPQRQTLMRTLGKLHAENTWGRVVEILENEDENAFVRGYAAEALGLMEKEESVPVLIKHYSANDPNLRQYVIKGLACFPENQDAVDVLIQAVRDEYWKVRQEAIKIIQEKDIKGAMDFLIYRAENDEEKVIKNNCIEAIAKLNTDEGNAFLIEQLNNKKTSDAIKTKIVEVLLKENHAGEKEILELAEDCLADDKKKNLRYAIGKELAKNSKPEFEEICAKFLDSKDATTVSLGLDMYKNCKFESVEPKMREIAADKKANAGNKNRIKKMLNIEEEDNKTENSNAKAK